MSEELRFVSGCGVFKRVIFYAEGKVHVGCFMGTFDEVREAVQVKYKRIGLADYLAKIDELERRVNDPNYKFDPEKFDWSSYSSIIARYAPQHFDPKLYSWWWNSGAVAQHCPEKLDPELFNWECASAAVERHCPEKMKLKPKVAKREYRPI
jgi:hypothetical protein